MYRDNENFDTVFFSTSHVRRIRDVIIIIIIIITVHET